MKKEDLKQIGGIVEKVVDKRVSQAETRINKHTDQKIDKKIDGLARSVNNSFGKLEKRADDLEEKFDDIKETVDDNSMSLDRIERQMRTESETLDEHDTRLKVLEKTRY